MSAESLLRYRFLAVKGYAYRISLTLEGAGMLDPLQEAVIDLVRLGFQTLGQLKEALPAFSDNMLRAVVDDLLQHGQLATVENSGRLETVDAVDRAGNAIRKHARGHGWIFWDPIGARLLPQILLGKLTKPEPGNPDELIGKDTPLMPPGGRPRLRDVRQAMRDSLRANMLQIWERKATNEAMEHLQFERPLELNLPDDTQQRPVTLWLPVQLRGSYTGEPNLVFWNSVMVPEKPPASDLWNEAEAALLDPARSGDRGESMLADVTQAWRDMRLETNPFLYQVHGYSSMAEFKDAQVRRLRRDLGEMPAKGPWFDDTLYRRVLSAMELESFARIEPDLAMRYESSAAREWAALLEMFSQKLVEEVKEGLKGLQLPASFRQDVAIHQLEHELGSLPSETVEGVRKTVNKYQKTITDVLKDKSLLGAGAGLSLWILAALEPSWGATEHVARIKRSLTLCPDLLHRYSNLITARNDAMHGRDSTLLPLDVLARDTLTVWRALAHGASSAPVSEAATAAG